MQSTLLEKTSGKFFGPNSAGPVCIAHPTATPGQSYNWKQSGAFLWLTVYSMLCVIRDGELGSGSCSKIWLSFSVCLFARHYISSVLKLYGKHFGLTVTLHCCCSCLKTLKLLGTGNDQQMVCFCVQKVKVMVAKTHRRRSSGLRELCTLLSDQPVIDLRNFQEMVSVSVWWGSSTLN